MALAISAASAIPVNINTGPESMSSVDVVTVVETVMEVVYEAPANSPAEPTPTDDVVTVVEAVTVVPEAPESSLAEPTPSVHVVTVVETVMEGVTEAQPTSIPFSRPVPTIVKSDSESPDPFRFLAFFQAVHEVRRLPKEARARLQASGNGRVETYPVPAGAMNWTYHDVLGNDYAAASAAQQHPTQDFGSNARNLGLGLGLGLGLPVVGGSSIAFVNAIRTSEMAGTDVIEEVGSTGLGDLVQADLDMQAASEFGYPADFNPESVSSWLDAIPKDWAPPHEAMTPFSDAVEPASEISSLDLGLDGAMEQVEARALSSISHAAENMEKFGITNPNPISLMSEAEGVESLASQELPQMITDASYYMDGAWPYVAQRIERIAEIATKRGVQVSADTIKALDEVVTVGSRGLARSVMEGTYSRELVGWNAKAAQGLIIEPDQASEWRYRVERERPKVQRFVEETYKAVRDILNDKPVDLTLARKLAYKIARTRVPDAPVGTGSTAESLLDVISKLAQPTLTVANEPFKWGGEAEYFDHWGKKLNDGRTPERWMRFAMKPYRSIDEGDPDPDQWILHPKLEEDLLRLQRKQLRKEEKACRKLQQDQPPVEPPVEPAVEPPVELPVQPPAPPTPSCNPIKQAFRKFRQAMRKLSNKIK
ncbi:hypothetical protein DIS24_g12322, partial [Lasiodiplodia hormozganensis]